MLVADSFTIRHVPAYIDTTTESDPGSVYWKCRSDKLGAVIEGRTTPLCRHRVHDAVSIGRSAASSTSNPFVRRIGVEEGWRALYKGLGATLVGIIPARYG